MRNYLNKLLLLLGLCVSLVWPVFGMADSSVGTPSAALVFIDTKTILRDSEPARNGRSQSEVIALANAAIKQVAERYQLGMVFQDVVYASPRAKITNEVLGVLAGLRIDEKFEIPQLRVGFLKTRDILATASSAWGLQQTDPSLITKVNNAIREVAETRGVDLIFQEAVYASQAVDVTRAIINAIKGAEGPGEAVGVELNGNSVRFISTERILKESKPARESQAQVKNLFGSRNEDLAKVVKLANQEITRIAKAKKIDLVFQKAVYVSPSLDMTEVTLTALEANKN